jgi:hypothetical protein
MHNLTLFYSRQSFNFQRTEKANCPHRKISIFIYDYVSVCRRNFQFPKMRNDRYVSTSEICMHNMFVVLLVGTENFEALKHLLWCEFYGGLN